MQIELGSSDTTAFDIANTLSKYFSSIGEKLANQIEKPILAAPKTSPASNLQTSFFLSPTCPEEVQQEISNLDAKKVVPIEWKPLNTSSVNATNRLLHPNCLARNFPNPLPL